MRVTAVHAGIKLIGDQCFSGCESAKVRCARKKDIEVRKSQHRVGFQEFKTIERSNAFNLGIRFFLDPRHT